MSKIELAVNVRHDVNGRQVPLSIIWEDGRVFSVDKILDVRRAASLKAGGVGMRYICKIGGKRVALFDDEGQWFMET